MYVYAASIGGSHGEDWGIQSTEALVDQEFVMEAMAHLQMIYHDISIKHG